MGRGSPPWKQSNNSHSSHSWCRRSTVSSYTVRRGQTVLGSLTAEIFQFPPQSLHSCLRKKAQLPDRVTTDVQALSHPIAVLSHSHGQVQDLADENQTYPLLHACVFPPTAAAVTAKCQLSPKRESKYCAIPTSSTNVRGHWWG